MVVRIFRGGAFARYVEVVEALEQLEAPLQYVWSTVSHLSNVMNSDDLRAVQDKMVGCVSVWVRTA